MDVHHTHRLLCTVCSPADIPALSWFLSSHAAANCASECSCWSQPAASAGSHQPQPAAAHSVSGYKHKVTYEENTLAAVFWSICHSVNFVSAGHWFVNQLWACFQITKKLTSPLLLSSCTIVELQKQPCNSYPPSSTPQKWVCCTLELQLAYWSLKMFNLTDFTEC